MHCGRSVELMRILQSMSRGGMCGLQNEFKMWVKLCLSTDSRNCNHQRSSKIHSHNRKVNDLTVSNTNASELQSMYIYVL